MRSEEYRSKAAACLLAAENFAKLPDVRARWLAMAQAWNRLADEAERRELHHLLIERELTPKTDNPNGV